jgi:potassium efflux system protein
VGTSKLMRTLLMRPVTRHIVGLAILAALFVLSGYAKAQEQPHDEESPAVQKESAEALPDIDEVIPLSAELSSRLAVLEDRIASMPDFSGVQRAYADIETRLEVLAGRLGRLKEVKDYRYVKLIDIKQELEKEQDLSEKISLPLSKSIRQLGTWRKEWRAEKERWNRWESSMRYEGELEQIKSTFAKANVTIDKALELIRSKLEEMLAVQEKAAALRGRIGSLTRDVDNMKILRKRNIMLADSPPMLSSRYFSQFGNELWSAVSNGIDEISWPGRSFFDLYWWTVLLDGFLFFAVVITVFRNRRLLLKSERWRFIGARPLATAFFLSFMSTWWLYEYQGTPPAWKLVISIILGFSLIRLAGGLVERSWKKHFLYGVLVVLIINKLLYVANMPLPLIRLYVVLVALTGSFFCLRWARKSGLQGESHLYAWSLRLGGLCLAFIMIAQLWGKQGLALYLFSSLTDSLAVIPGFMLFMYVTHGGVEWLFRVSPHQRAGVLNTGNAAIVRHVEHFLDFILLALFLLPVLLRIWGVFDNLEGAMQHLWHFGVRMGSQRITVVLVVAAAGVFYGSLLLSWIFQRVFVDKVLVSRQVERGVRLAVGRLVHYAFILAGFLLVLPILGVEITKLTIMLSALGVGIGFGLQGVVNNFVSGLILLFERPVRVGDFIEFGGNWSEVRSIGLRSTTVQTFDSSDVIIPNADLISNQVTNWTLSNRRRRVDIPVGVAYGSDISLVVETLMSCASGNTMLLEEPAPQVLFLRFGDSSLEFELRVFVSDVRNSMTVISELHREIDRRFREARIEIAFPQRDLHVRSVDESVKVRVPETGKQDTP